MAIQTEIWLADIEGNLFPDNQFYVRSIDDSPFVMNGKTVHIPQGGAKPAVEKNRSVLPATIAKRTDSEGTYNLDEFTTDPVLLQNTEEIELSYAKRQNILTEHMQTLDEQIADNFAYAWTPFGADNIVRTTGSTRATTLSGATGTRKAPGKDDFISVAELMDRMNITRQGRFLLIPSVFLADIMKISEFVEAHKIGAANLVNGTIGQLLGFNIFVRASVVSFDNQATPVVKAPGAAAAATDNNSCLAWQTNAVCRAKGDVKVFIDEDKPEYYGDIFSALVRAGGRKRRTDQKGVVSLVETWVI